MADHLSPRIEKQDDERLGFEKADRLLEVARYVGPRVGNGTIMERLCQCRDHQSVGMFKCLGSSRSGAFANQRGLRAERLIQGRKFGRNGKRCLARVPDPRSSEEAFQSGITRPCRARLTQKIVPTSSAKVIGQDQIVVRKAYPLRIISGLMAFAT